MASVFRKPLSPFWHAAFTDAKGARRQRSTKQKNRAEAMKIALQWQALADKGRAGSLTAAQARAVVADIVQQVTGESLSFYSARSWLAEWLAGKRGAVGDRSEEKYEQVTKDFLEFLGERAGAPLGAISPRDVRGFRDAKRAAGLAATSVNQTIRKVLSAPFNAAVRLGYLATNPCAAVEPLRDADAGAERDTFTAEQVAALLAHADDEWRGIVLFGYSTGLRLRDAAGLMWGQLDLVAGIAFIKPRKSAAKGKRLALPLHRDFLSWLKGRAPGSPMDYVFPENAERQTSGEHGLSGRFQAIMAEAEITGRVLREGGDGKGRTIKSLSFHSLRHSFVSELANAGVDREMRQQLSGHADEKTHSRYTHHDIKRLKKAAAKIPSVL